MAFQLETSRLILRPWRDGDLEPLAALNGDPIAMRFMRGVLNRAGSDAYAARCQRHFEEHGFCKWAVEAPGVAPFIGAVGLMHVGFEASFTPAVEVAWRLLPGFWGKGYAPEAAAAALRDGFERVGLTEIVALTAAINTPSLRVMEKLGMTRAETFEHPMVVPGSPLRRHVLYRIGPYARDA